MCGRARITPRPAASASSRMLAVDVPRCARRTVGGVHLRQPEGLQPVARVGAHARRDERVQVRSSDARADDPAQVRPQLRARRRCRRRAARSATRAEPAPRRPAAAAPCTAAQPAAKPRSTRPRSRDRIRPPAGAAPADCRYTVDQPLADRDRRQRDQHPQRDRLHVRARRTAAGRPVPTSTMISRSAARRCPTSQRQPGALGPGLDVGRHRAEDQAEQRRPAHPAAGRRPRRTTSERAEDGRVGDPVAGSSRAPRRTVEPPCRPGRPRRRGGRATRTPRSPACRRRTRRGSRRRARRPSRRPCRSR